MSIAEIKSKLKTATPAQLTAILAILNPPKQRATNAWVEYLKEYKSKHVDETHKTAMSNALKLYKQQKEKPATVVVREKKEKVKKPRKIIKCDICGFEPANKSNLNRHMKTAHTREKTMLSVAKVRGLEARYTKRLVSKNPEVKAEAVEKLKEVEVMRAGIVKALARLEGVPKTVATANTNKTVIAKAPRQASLPKSLIDGINITYKKDNNSDLNFTQSNIKAVSKIDNTYTVDTINLSTDDSRIDQIVITKDEDSGHEVYFLEEVTMKDKTKRMTEVDSLFIYD